MKKDFMARELTMEVVVGFFMIMMLFGLGYFTFVLSGEKWGKQFYYMDVVFSDVMGLRQRDSVIVRGMPVGEVQRLNLVPQGVKVSLRLTQEIPLRTTYRIMVERTSILGGRNVGIVQGTGDVVSLKEGESYHGEDPRDIMSDAAELVNAAKHDFVGTNGVLANLRDASEDLKTLIGRLTSGRGSLGRFLSEDETFYKDISAASASFRTVADRLEKGEGAVGRLLKDDKLYKDVEGAIGEVRAAVDDFRETAPVVTFTSILFGAF